MQQIYSLTKEYILTRTIGIGELKLVDKKDNQIVSKLSTSFLEKDEWVESLIGTKSKWFVIHADKNNYISHFRYKKDSQEESKIIFTPPVAIDKIYKEKCNSWRRFWDTCNASYPYYSETLNRVFVSGYRPENNGHQWVTTEIIQGEAETSLPSKKIKNYIGDVPSLDGVLLRGHKDEVFFYDGMHLTKLSRSISSIEQDIPQLNGALLQGTKGEVLFYDGKTIVELSKDFPFNKNRKSWHVIKPTAVDRHKNTISNERIFLANFIGNNKKPKLFMELNKALSLKPISFPEEAMKRYILVFALPNDSRIWIVNSIAVLAEIEEKIQTVIKTAPASHIVSPAFVEQLEDGSISFHVAKDNTRQWRNNSINYFLKKASPTANCEVMLNADKPPILNPK